MPADRHLSNVGESGVSQNTTSVYNLSGTAVDATYQTFGDSPAADGEDIWVRLNSEDSDKYEIGLFTFNTGTPNTLTRVSTVESSNADSAVDFASENIEAIATVIPGQKMISGDHAPFEELSSDPDSPASGDRQFFAKSDGFYGIDSSGTVTGPFGPAGGVTLIGSQSISSATSSVDFTGFLDSAYDHYVLTWVKVVPSSGTSAYLRVSSDGGSNWDSGSSNYSYAAYQTEAGSGSDQGSDLATEIVLSAGQLYDSGSGIVRIYAPGDSNRKTLFTYESHVARESVPNYYGWVGGGARRAKQGDSGLRFLLDGANVNSGEFNLYGVST